MPTDIPQGEATGLSILDAREFMQHGGFPYSIDLLSLEDIMRRQTLFLAKGVNRNGETVKNKVAWMTVASHPTPKTTKVPVWLCAFCYYLIHNS